MGRMILVRHEGNSNAELLEKKVLALKDEFSKEGIEIRKELKKSLEFGAVGGTLILTLVGWIAIPLISKLIDKLFEIAKDTKDVNIQINIREINTTFNFPEDKKKVLDYYKDKNK